MFRAMLKLFIGLVSLGAALAYQKAVKPNYPAEPFSEVPCLSFGGICVVAEECPEGLLAKMSGLCPVQQRQGVECCHGLPQSERRCSRRGGECIPLATRCPENLTYREAIDCEADQKCCILV